MTDSSIQFNSHGSHWEGRTLLLDHRDLAAFNKKFEEDKPTDESNLADLSTKIAAAEAQAARGARV